MSKVNLKEKAQEGIDVIYDNFTAIMGLVILLLFLLATGYIIWFKVTGQTASQPSCKSYENLTVDSVPVRCFEYFKINVIETR